MAVFKNLSLDSPLELHEDSVDCLKNEVTDLAWVLDLVVDDEVAEDGLDAEENEVFRLSWVELGFVLDFENVQKDFLLDFNYGLVVLEITEKLWEYFVEKYQHWDVK